MNDVNQWLEKNVQVIYSPFRELLTSLHVLYNPAHHLPRLEWAKGLKKNMETSFLEISDYFGELSNEWLNFLDLKDYLKMEEKHPEEAIEKLGQLSEEEFINFFLGKRARLTHKDQTLSEREVFSKPRYFQEKLCNFLYEYQQNFFARELFKVEPWLVKSVHELKKGIDEDPFEAIDAIHPRFRLERKFLKFFKAETWMLDYEEINTIKIYPSSFIAPHLLVGLELPEVIVYLHVALPGETEQSAVPQDLISVLTAIGDKTRLNLLRTLIYHPYCTQQLTELTGLAKATVSKHLKILEMAGLIQSERHGYFVFYRTHKEKLEQVKVDLNQFFDQPLMNRMEEL